MSFAAVLAAMPDLLAKALAEHVPDDAGACRECRDDEGSAAPFPCAMRLLAEEASGIVVAPRPAPDVVDPPADQGSAAGHDGAAYDSPVPEQGAPVIAEQRPLVISDQWDPIADRRAFRRSGFLR